MSDPAIPGEPSQPVGRPTEDEIRHGIDGNLCRCTGYQHIVNAVKAAAKAQGA